MRAICHPPADITNGGLRISRTCKGPGSWHGHCYVRPHPRPGTHSYALRRNGTLWGWGINSDGALGTGTDRQTSPVPLAGLTDVREISSRGRHVLARRGDGTVWSWGHNSAGQLGDGTTENRAAPVQVPGLTGVVDVSAGPGYSLAVEQDGTVWSWGFFWGFSTPPMPVPELSNMVAVAGGEQYALALGADGTVWGWGINNWCGQLGDGTRETRFTLVQTQGLTGAEALFAFGALSAAIREDGTVVGWGSNGFGELGAGLSPLHLEPTRLPLSCRLKGQAPEEAPGALKPCSAVP